MSAGAMSMKSNCIVYPRTESSSMWDQMRPP